MKKCHHGNIVRLFEVIDDPQQDKIFLGEPLFFWLIAISIPPLNVLFYYFKKAMEYLAGGPIQWSDTYHQPILSIQQTRRIIRDVILGLEYRKPPFYNAPQTI